MRRLLQSGFGIILAYAVAALAACGLQLVPYLGWVVLAMAGPLWVGFLIHLMLAHLATGAALRMISLAWLVLPVAYYGSGFALHSVSLDRARAQANAIEQAAQKATIKVDQPFSFLDEAGADGSELLKLYQVDRMFLKQGRGRITTEWFARGEECYDVMRNPGAPGQPSMLQNLFQGRCILAQDRSPATWQYRIERRDLPQGDMINARFGSLFSVVDETNNATLLTVENGTIGTLPLVQTVVVTCSLYTGPLRCSFGLLPGTTIVPVGHKLLPPGYSNFVETDDPDTWQIGILARALSIEPRTRSD